MTRQLHLNLSLEINSRLTELSKKLGRTKSDLVKEGILLILDKYKDFFDNDKSKVYLEKVKILK